MSNVGNKYKVGVLVLVSFTLLVLSFLSLGVMKYFRKTFEFYTIVQASVQGLEKGAKVKIKGVTVGQVTKIQIMEEAEGVIIFMSFDPEMFASSYYKKIELSRRNERTFIETVESAAKKEGMRCQLQYAGITGNLYVQIGYYDPNQYPYKAYNMPAHMPPFVPSIPSVTIDNIMEESQKAIIKLGNVDFEKLSTNLEEFLTSSNQLIADVKKDLKDLQLSQTSEKIRTFLDTSNDVLRKTNSLQNEMKSSVKNFNETLISTRELINYLEKNPNSIITGKHEEPVIKSK